MTVKALRRQLMAAIAMVVVSIVALSSSTYAWFAANRTVTAQAMNVQAVAENGLVIANTDKTGWSSVADAKVTSATLIPTSAATVASPTWVHTNSTVADEAQANQEVAKYNVLTLSWSDAGSNTGVGYVDTDGNSAKDTNERAYVLKNTFYIKSSGDDITGTNLLINDVTVTGADKAVENSLRVLVVVSDGTTTVAKTYAPVKDIDSGITTMNYKWKNTTDVMALDATAAAGYDVQTGITTIPSTDVNAISVTTYVYFEGEDDNCKSTNISGITTNTLSVTIKLGLDTLH